MAMYTQEQPAAPWATGQIPPYQKPTMQANYFVSLSMEDDDNDDVTIVTSNVADSSRRGVDFGAQPPTYIPTLVLTIVPPIRSYQQPKI